MSDLKQFYYKKNRFQQLKGFYYTAQLGNITEAAKKMGLTQSTVTLQIQSLERDLKTTLFKRNSNSLKLTDDGKLLYDMASYHMQAINSIYENFLKEKEEKRPLRIDLAVHHIAISYLLPPYVKKFADLYPDVTIGIKNISPEIALKRLLNDEIDIMIYPNLNVSSEFLSKTFCSFDPVIIMHKNHPLAQVPEPIELTDINKYNTVRIDHNLITLPLFEAISKEFNFKTNIDFENANWEILKHYVKNDIGVGFVSTICIDEKDDLVYKNLNQYFPKMNYQIIVKKGKILDEKVKDFIRIIDQDYPI